jgi:hypothetical protein
VSLSLAPSGEFEWRSDSDIGLTGQVTGRYSVDGCTVRLLPSKAAEVKIWTCYRAVRHGKQLYLVPCEMMDQIPDIERNCLRREEQQ